MKPAIDVLEERISAAMDEVTGRVGCAAIVKAAVDPKFGDYQANGVMALAKELKTNPRQLAIKVVEKLDVSDICETPEVAGPGFINLRFKTDYLASRLLQISADWNAHQGIERIEKPRTVVVDFSGPNIAKQMHVGHLRSTIIGDCLCRLLEFQGHTVIRQNHIGDWGTQFGMLIAYFYRRFPKAAFHRRGSSLVLSDISVRDMNIPDMEAFYREAKKLYDSDPDFAAKSREYVVKLQSGDQQVWAIWLIIRDQSMRYCQDIYHHLGVKLGQKDIRGESEYNDMLPDVVEELTRKNIAVKSDGAVCVFPPGFKNKEGEPLPLIIQKSDGAFLYATTDLAALRYRVQELRADEIIYVTDARQGLHFEMVFAVGRMAGWVGENVKLNHVTFGSVLGVDGKPLKTRSGENVKLRELLDEAVERARAVVEEKNPELSAGEKDKIAKAVGIGAVKYADYSNNRTSDYVFSFDKMLAMEGNTAPYMQYAYARIKSIERKAESKDVDVATELAGISKLNLADTAELDLAKSIVRYGEAIEAAIADYRPNYLTAYLYDLATKFSAFYTNCPVLQATPEARPTRLLLCDLTAKTIRHGLTQLLGIDVVEQM